MSAVYSVLFSGRLEPGTEREQALSALAREFGIQPERIRELLASGDEVVLASGLSEAVARAHQQALGRLGVDVRVAAVAAAGGGAQAGYSGETPARPAATAGASAGAAAGERGPPRAVPASHGWLWLQQGFVMVFASPAGWIGALLIWVVLNLVLNVIPLAGLLAALLAPVLMGGLMLGARAQDQGGGFDIESLFAGFSQRTGPLFAVGVVYMAGFIVIGLVMLMAVGGFMAFLVSMESPEAQMTRELVASPAPWLAVLLVVILLAGLMMAYWFAPALVVLDGVSPLRAMGLSFRACLRNLVPFVLYAATTILLCVLGAIPLFLGLLIVIPGITASVYCAWRDIFRAAGDA